MMMIERERRADAVPLEDGGWNGFLPRSVATMQAVARARTVFELGLDVSAFLFLPILVLASRGAAPLAAVAGVCALGLVADNLAIAWQRVRRLAPFFAALVVWGLISSLWAIEPQRSLLMSFRLTGLFVAGLALIAAAGEIRAPQRLLYCLLAGFALSLGLAAAQYATDGALTAPLGRRVFIEPTLNNIEDGFGLLLPPLCTMLILLRRRVAAAVLALPTVIVIFLLVGDAARIAFIAGIAAASALYLRREWLTRPAAVASVVFILAAPAILPPLADIAAVRQDAREVKFSAWHRLEIWSFVGGKMAEKPVFGWGLDSSRAIPGGSAPIPGSLSGQPWLPLHPHNAALQIWLELGAPGAILFAWLAAWVWLKLGAVMWPPLFTAAAGSSLVTALIVAFGSYGVWQEWWIGTEFLVAFLILVMARLAGTDITTRLSPD
jgi:exopolysaccharide production protein ExoQ